VAKAVLNGFLLIHPGDQHNGNENGNDKNTDPNETGKKWKKT
jgi:hypothetical protein